MVKARHLSLDRYNTTIFVLSIIVMLCISSCSLIVSSNPTAMIKNANTTRTEFTHPIFGEFGAHLGCPNSKYALGALQNIYDSGEYPFYYVSLLKWNRNTAQRYEEYNLTGYPKVYFDGGYQVVSGASSVEQVQAEYEEKIIECGPRPVADIDVNLSVEWHGNAEMTIVASIHNNESSVYEGHLRIYVTEITSTMGWKDDLGNKYSFAFLDYAMNRDISINAGWNWERTIQWNGYEHDDGHFSNFGRITHDNVMVFAVVFNDEWHQGYGRPPDDNLFDAYYVDSVVAQTPVIYSEPPENPTISGPNSGEMGNEYEYTISTSEPEGDDVYYWIDWGDGHFQRWTGPYDPTSEVQFAHLWDHEGTFDIRVKAKDVYDAESDWSSPLEVSVDALSCEIHTVDAGLGTVQALITNTLVSDIEDIAWRIDFVGGLSGLKTMSFTGDIRRLPTGKDATLLPNEKLHGIGSFNVTIAVSATNPPIECIANTQVRMIGPFINLQ